MLIKENVMEFILGVSRELYPKEFICHLRGNSEIIEEAIILPKTIYGRSFSSVREDMKPIDKSIIGSAHSHPAPSYVPSNAVLRFFSKFGFIHLIIRYPYKSINDIAAYNSKGERILLKVLSF